MTFESNVNGELTGASDSSTPVNSCSDDVKDNEAVNVAPLVAEKITEENSVTPSEVGTKTLDEPVADSTSTQDDEENDSDWGSEDDSGEVDEEPDARNRFLPKGSPNPPTSGTKRGPAKPGEKKS